MKQDVNSIELINSQGEELLAIRTDCIENSGHGIFLRSIYSIINKDSLQITLFNEEEFQDFINGKLNIVEPNGKIWNNIKIK